MADKAELIGKITAVFYIYSWNMMAYLNIVYISFVYIYFVFVVIRMYFLLFCWLVVDFVKCDLANSLY
jgi:hypothetical protein